MNMLLYILALRLAITSAQSTACDRPSFWCTFGGSEYLNQDCDGDNVADHACLFNGDPFLFIGSSNNCAVQSVQGSSFPSTCVDVVDCSTQDCTVPCEGNVQCLPDERIVSGARCD